MSNIWDKFDDAYDTKKLANEVSETEKNGTGNYEKVPYDTYIVKVEKLELSVTKESNKPKLVVWFKIVEGEHKNKLIFMNQILTGAFLIHKSNEFLRSLDSGINVNFESFSQYNDLILDVHEKITAEKLEYQLEYGQDKNKYDTFNIIDVFTSN